MSLKVNKNFYDVNPEDKLNDSLVKIPDIEQRCEEFCACYVERIKKGDEAHHAEYALQPPTSRTSHRPCDEPLQLLLRNEGPAFPNALICGHTHRRVIGEVVPDFHCVNMGSDYGMLMYYLLKL